MLVGRFPSDLRAPREETLGSLAWLLLVCAGGFVGGLFGCVVALLALIALRRFGGAVVLRAAFFALVLAAVATVALAWPNARFDVSFAIHRAVAAALGQAAAVLALVGIAAAARRGATPPAPSRARPQRSHAAPPPSPNGRAPGRSWMFRLGRRCARTLGPIVLLLSALALLAVLTNGGRHYVIDNHWDLAWTPLRLLGRQRTLWNGDQGFGRPNEESWFVVSLFFSALRAVGISAEVAGRLFHAALLITAGTGMVVLIRQFRSRIGIGHLAAGVLYMFNPYTASALLPSILFVPYALAPWFLVCFFRGVRGRQPWRWAALFALLVLVAGTADIPGLTFGLLPLIPAAVFVVYIDRSAGWGRILRWLGRALLLTVGLFAAPLIRVFLGGEALSQRVGTSESPKALNVASSWAESWRGLGFWLSYWKDGGGAVHPESAAYFSSPITILATFAAPCVALAALCWTRYRVRLLFALTAVVALVFMVGSYPIKDPSPYGHLLLRGYAQSLFLWGWRNSYKAGPGLAIGVAGLVGLAAFDVWRRYSDRATLRTTVAVLATVVIGLASFPFWTNHLYAARDRLAVARPEYWRQANAWLDRHARNGRVLVLPGMTIPSYRWGNFGGDAVETKASTLMYRTFPFETAQSADLLGAIQRSIANGTAAGSIGPIARRLGVRYIVLQNDLDWQKIGAPRPAVLRDFRSDPALKAEAVFGAPGTNMTDASDRSLAALYEAQLPPVEIYSVRDEPEGLVRPGPARLVSGSGDAWPALARDGALDDGRPVVYTASVSPAQLKSALRAGSDVVITDTNRRRITHSTAYNEQASYTLGLSEKSDRPPNPLFPHTDAESIALYGDATVVHASGYGSALVGDQPWLRPANAFDGDPRTTWQAGGGGFSTGSWILIEFPKAKRVSEVELIDAPMPGTGPYVTKASILFSDGSSVPANLDSGSSVVQFRPRTTEWVGVRVDAVAPWGNTPVGFSEIKIPGVSAAEQIRLPEDVFVTAQKDKALQHLLDRAPVEYQFERLRGTDGRDEELVLHRQFRSAGQREYDVTGSAQVLDSTPDQELATLLGGPNPTYGSSRVGGPDVRGGKAHDGDPNTSWAGSAEPGERLTTKFEPGPVSTVAVDVNADGAHSLVHEVRITAGDASAVATLPQPESCPKEGPCIVRVSATFPGTSASEATVEATRVEQRTTPFGPAPIGIAEMSVNGQAGSPDDPARPLEGCFGSMAQVDGHDLSLSLDGTVDDVLAERPLPVRGCGPALALGPGRHRLDSTKNVLLNDLRLRTDPQPQAGHPAGRLESASGTSTRLKVDAGPGGFVLSGQSYDPGWRATAAGRGLGPTIAADTQSAWKIPAGKSRTVEMRYAPERTYRVAAWVSLAFFVICVWLFARRPRRRQPPVELTRPQSVRVPARSST